MNSYFGLDPVIDLTDAAKLALRFLLNFTVVWTIVQLIYCRYHKNREFLFTFYMLSTITFALCFLLRKVPAEFGFALAIFAVFGILRYRTEQIRIRELTYLFIVIGLGVINAIANKSVGLIELLLVNSIIVSIAFVIEHRSKSHRQSSLPIFYDKLELLRPDRQADLLTDLELRTGLNVTHIEIENYDLLRDAANLKIFYRSQ